MSKRTLDLLNKYRTKVKPKSRPTGNKVEPGSTPKQDLALPTDEAYDLMIEFQKAPIVGHKANEDGEQSEVHPPFNESYAMPVLSKAFKKSRLKDYRPGKVKVYTKEEIEEYENLRRRT